jgi:hypothetical protein
MQVWQRLACVKDDHTFLWQHTIFAYMPNWNPSTDQYEILHNWLVRYDLICKKWLESVGCERLHKWVEYNLKNFSHYSLPYITLPYLVFLVNLFHRGLTDLHARWLKRRGLFKGCAFWGSRWCEMTFRGQNPTFCYLNAEFPAKTMYSILKMWKSRITCKRLQIDEKHQCNTIRKPMWGNRLVTSDLLWSST